MKEKRFTFATTNKRILLELSYLSLRLLLDNAEKFIESRTNLDNEDNIEFLISEFDRIDASFKNKNQEDVADDELDELLIQLQDLVNSFTPITLKSK